MLRLGLADLLLSRILNRNASCLSNSWACSEMYADLILSGSSLCTTIEHSWPAIELEEETWSSKTDVERATFNLGLTVGLRRVQNRSSWRSLVRGNGYVADKPCVMKCGWPQKPTKLKSALHCAVFSDHFGCWDASHNEVQLVHLNENGIFVFWFIVDVWCEDNHQTISRPGKNRSS